MIAEPYICIKGSKAGEIVWCDEGLPLLEHTYGGGWRPYADHEREKLRALKMTISIRRGSTSSGFCAIQFDGTPAYGSFDIIHYSEGDYDNDTESSRLLKRAEFLKAVCEKEGVAWMPGKPKGKLYISDDGVNYDFAGTITNIRFEIDSSMPDNELKIRDEQSGDEVRAKNIGRDKCNCNYPVHQHSCPQEGRRYWLHDDQAEKKQPERDYYTKEEVDERMGAIFDQLESLISTIEFVGKHGKKGVVFPSGWKDQVTELRRLFL